DAAERIHGASFDAWLLRALADPPEGVRRLLRRRPRGRDAPGPRELLRDAGWDLCEHRDFDAPWRRDPWAREGALEAALGELRKLGELAPRARDPEDWLAKSIAEVHRFVSDVDRREAVRGRDHDGLEAELGDIADARWWNRR